MLNLLKNIVLILGIGLMLSSCSNVASPSMCPPNTVIEWVDMLMIDDIKYEHYFSELANENLPIIIEKGRELGKVTYQMADSACSNHKMQNGDAAFLEEGTIIYEVKGYPTSLMVAANDSVYVANSNNKAKTAGELYPMENLVKNIYIESTEDGKRLLTFSQPSKDNFLAAFNELKLEDIQALNDAGKLDGTRVFLEIELDNGVSFRQIYWVDSNTFHIGAIGNAEIQQIINDEVSKIK